MAATHVNMKTAQDLRVQEKCQNCEFPRKDFFCNLPPVALTSFQAIKITRGYPKGKMLFVQGQPSNAVFMLCQGKVKLSTCSLSGKVMILGIAEPGEIVGLSAAVNRVEYEMTAEVLEQCQVNYVETTDLLHFFKEHPEAGLNAARQLGRNYQTAHHQICSLGLSDSACDKLAKLFLSWTGNGSGVIGRIQIKNFFTHEEIAEMIGSSRETVTRTLKNFRERELVTLKGSDLVIHDRQRLKAAIGSNFS